MAQVFGNLRWSRCGKSVEARRLYKAQLCASCHAMRDFSGRPSSLLANYDQSLLVLVLSALAGGAVESRRCTAIPWRTVDVQDLPPALRTFAAAGNLALVDAKLRDDLDDGGRWFTAPLRWLLRRKTRRAIAHLEAVGFPTGLVVDLPKRQAQVEQHAEIDLAGLAEPSANLLGAIFAHGGRLAGAGEQASVLERFGRAVARAVYGFDALDDHDDDRTKGRFNAVAHVADRVGHHAAVEAARAFVEHAAIEAQQCATVLLPRDRSVMVAEVLQRLTQRAGACRDHLLGRPAAAAVRPAEAGDCDCACDGCSGCDGCDCSCDGADGGGCCHGNCCDPCCWSDSNHRSQKATGSHKRQSEAHGMPLED